MKLSFSTNAYTSGKYTLIQAINKIAEAGYKGVEILADRPLLWPFSVTKKEINETRKTLAERALNSTINAFTCSQYWTRKGWSKKPPKGGGPSGQKFGPCFCDYEEEYRAKRITYTKKVIDLACQLGARDISTCSGYRPLRGTRELAWENMVKGLKEVVKYAEKKGTRINIEPEPGLLVGSAKEAEEVLKEIKSPNFGLTFDIGHFFVSDKNIPALIKKFRKRIHTVHVEDIGFDKKKRPVHYHLIPGRGEIPLKKIFHAFKEINYQGSYTVELYTYFKNPVFAARESFKYLTKLGKKLGL